MRISHRRLLVLPVSLVFLLACGPGSILGAIPGMKPTPSMNNLSTGSSPLSGDWNAAPEFGRFSFTVDPNGENIVTAVVKINNFHCGGTILTTETQVLNSWPLDNGKFSGSIDLGDTNEILFINFDGTYHSTTRTFAGTWDFDAHGTDCTGDWTSLPHK